MRRLFGRLVGQCALQRRAWIVQDRFAMRDEHDLDPPVEHATKFVTVVVTLPWSLWRARRPG
jgi:hypothetical protein